MLFTVEVFLTPQQFGVDLGEFLHLLLELAVVLDSVFSGLLLSGCLEEELIDFANRQALSQVIEWAMLGCAVMAVAIGLAAGGEASTREARRQSGKTWSWESRKRLRLRRAREERLMS